MSALPRRTDIPKQERQVRKVPIPEVANRIRSRPRSLLPRPIGLSNRCQGPRLFWCRRSAHRAGCAPSWSDQCQLSRNWGPPATALPLIELGEHACHWAGRWCRCQRPLFCNASRSGSDHPSYCRPPCGVHAALFIDDIGLALAARRETSASSKLCPLQLMHVETAIYALLLFC